MLRKLLFGAVASLALLSPLALPAQVDAQPNYPRHPHGHVYHVYFRECGHESWRCAGEYRFRDDAARAARNLRHRGFEAYVR